TFHFFTVYACRIIGTVADFQENPVNFNPRLLPTFSLSPDKASAKAGHCYSLCDCSVNVGSTGSKQTLNGLFYVYVSGPLPLRRFHFQSSFLVALSVTVERWQFFNLQEL